MQSLYILIPIAFFIAVVATLLFFWSIKSGQYEDLDTESKRILFDDADTRQASDMDKVKPQKQAENRSSKGSS